MARPSIRMMGGTRNLAEQCVVTRTHLLLDALIDADPLVIGKALVREKLVNKSVVMDPRDYQLASSIIEAISRLINIDPTAIKHFIQVLYRSNHAALKTVAKDMNTEMGYDDLDAATDALDPEAVQTVCTLGKTRSAYKMKPDRHGVALIINNIEWQLDKDGKPLMKTRDGAKEDADALKESLEALGYHVVCKENLTVEKMKQKLKKVCAENVRPDDDSFICYISSHGGKLGVYGVDKKCATVDELSKILEPDECPQLKHKPKIFFVQACHGRSTSEPTDGDDEEFVPSVPRRADFYLSYGTIDSKFAGVRHPYPRFLSKFLKEHSAELSLDEIVMEVHEEIAKEATERDRDHMQVAAGRVVHTLRGPVYFTNSKH